MKNIIERERENTLSHTVLSVDVTPAMKPTDKVSAHCASNKTGNHA